MRTPHFESVAKSALQDILVAMLKQDEGITCSAEAHLARAAMVLQQFVDCSTLDDELKTKLANCIEMVVPNYKRKGE